MAAQCLREKLGPEQDEMTISMIEKSAQRGANLVKQVLTFARGNATEEREPLQLNQIVREVMEIASKTFPSTLHLVQNLDQDCDLCIPSPRSCTLLC